MNFYILDNPRIKEAETQEYAITDAIQLDPMNVGSAPLCPVCKEPIGMLPWLPPYRAELEFWGDEAGDIAFAPGCELLVSERFLSLYKKARLNGLSGFYKIEIVRTKSYGKKKGIKPAGGYYLAIISRSRAMVDDKASELFRPTGRTCEECGGGDPQYAKRIVLQESSWSGEDVFFVRGLPGVVMTSERYKEFHIVNKINSGLLIEASQYSFDWRL